MANSEKMKFELIITIVNIGFSQDVVNAAKKAGATGGTILRGRGTGIHETMKLFGIPIEPEKDIILTLIDKNKTEAVIEAINEAVNLDKPGSGIAFVLEVEKAVGICHLEDECNNQTENMQ